MIAESEIEANVLQEALLRHGNEVLSQIASLGDRAAWSDSLPPGLAPRIIVLRAELAAVNRLLQRIPAEHLR